MAPRTPTPTEMRENPVIEPKSDSPESRQVTPGGKQSIALTPPPSATTALPQRPEPRRPDLTVLSPPPTIESAPDLPSMDTVQAMEVDELRALVGTLLPALGAARVSVAHARLQHSLLSIEKTEAINRAEVEHEATRREVQVLQHGSPQRSPQASSLQLALRHCRDLQDDNAALDRRLRSSKKLILGLDGKVLDLKQENILLRRRIRENRSHMHELQDSGVIRLSPRPATLYEYHVTPRSAVTSRDTMRRTASQTSQDPFDALLQASHVLNSAAQSRHVRGAHSMSSLPVTPVQRRVRVEAPHTTTGIGRVPCERDDRESTISASDEEEAMLGPAYEPSLRQTRIYGSVTKPGPEIKRPRTADDSPLPAKRLKYGPATHGDIAFVMDDARRR